MAIKNETINETENQVDCKKSLFVCVCALLLAGCEDIASRHVPYDWETASCAMGGTCTAGVCDESTGMCVECMQNPDCKDAAKPVCDVSGHVCVECSVDSDCASGNCNTAGHVCEGCATHSDCNDVAKPICNADSKMCEPCVADPQAANKCPEVSDKTPICVASGNKAGQCVECFEGSDCESGVCIGNVCKQCDEDHPCTGANEFCGTEGEAANMCIVCSDTVPCSNGLVCSELGTCVECNVDSDCKDGAKPACDVTNHVCVQCNVATEADNCSAETPVCDDALHLCVACKRASENEVENETCKALEASRPICLEDSENALNNRCVACDSATSGVQCVLDVNAPICNLDSEVGEANSCVACTENAQCEAKEGALNLCNTATGACVECLTVDDCGDGMLFCEDNKCGNCHVDNDCPSDICIDNVCVECKTDDDCKNPEKPACALEGIHKNHCVPCNTATQDENCRDKMKNEVAVPVCAVDDDPVYANQCYECNPGEDPAAKAADCAGKKQADETPIEYCASAPSTKAHFCVECIPDDRADENGYDESCKGVTKSGIASYICANEKAAQAVQNTCVECDDDAVKTQCTAEAAAPICNIDASSDMAYRCVACNITDAEKGNAQCAKKDESKPVCVTAAGNYDAVPGSCVECVTSADCKDGAVCNSKNQCVACTDRSDLTQCTNPEAAVCCDAASFTASRCTASLESDVYKCEKCDVTTNCVGGVCNGTSGRCDPCTADSECVTVERGICAAETGVCEKCEDSGTDKNCNMVCSSTTGKCEPCVDVDDDPAKINCGKVCDSVTDTCEPCDNVDYFCKKGVCNLTEGSDKYGFCEPCSTENCPDGTCGADGLCHKICSVGTLCTKEGLDINREDCCEGTEICTTAGTCIVPGDGCRKDSDCSVWDYCDIPDGEEFGVCVPITSDPEACFTIPEFEPIKPKIKWHYKDEIVSTPIVIDLTGDGVPEVVFTNNSYKLTAVNGENGTAVSVSTQTVFNKHNDIAAADIDNDNIIEVLVPSATKSAATTGLYVMNLAKTGESYSWNQKAFFKIPTADLSVDNDIYWPDVHPTVADLDEDGWPEIITTRGIIKGKDIHDTPDTADWYCKMKMGQFGTWYHYMFAVADLDQDGESEIIVDKIYDKDCNVILDDSLSSGYGYAAVADVLPDSGEPGELVPEIVRVKSGYVAVWKVYKNGTTWSQKKIWETKHPGSGGGNPVIADFDGDGKVDIGVAGKTKISVFNGQTGAEMWSKTTDDASSYKTGAAVFDFEADGKAEVVYRDQAFIRIYNGSDGTVLWGGKDDPESRATSGTVIDYPLIVDVDADGQTEIVVATEKKADYTSNSIGNGIVVYTDTYGKWVPARKIWNQHSYHVTNINDDGSVPQHEEANWLNRRLNNYRANIPPQGFYNQPNFVPGLLVEDKTNCKASPSTLGLQATVANLGDKDIAGEIQVSFYLESPDGAQKYYIGTNALSGLLIDDKKTLTLIWDQKTVYPVADGKISDTSVELGSISGYKAVFTVDDAANSGLSEYEECNEDDNSLKTSQYLILTGCR